MPFLALNGTTVRIRSNAADQVYDPHRRDANRMFDGAMRVIQGGIYRRWELTSALMDQTDYLALVAILESSSLPLAATGDLMDGEEVAVMPLIKSASPVHRNGALLRHVAFTLWETPAALPADTSAVPWLFFRRGVGYWQDFARTTPALDGDRIRIWDDSSGNLRHGRGELYESAIDVRPIRDGTTLVRCGTGLGDAEARSGFRIPQTSLLTEIEIMIGLRASNDPAEVAAGIRSAMYRFTEGEDPSQYPDTDGMIVETLGSPPHDVVNPSTDLSDAIHVWNASASSITEEYIARLDNVEVDRKTMLETGASPFNFNAGHTQVDDELDPLYGPTLFFGHFGGAFDGWGRDVLIVNGLLTTRQRASWYDYMRGATDDPPLPE